MQEANVEGQGLMVTPKVRVMASKQMHMGLWLATASCISVR